MSVRIIRGNALHLPIADATVDLVVTSPPYFGLRSYQDGGEHYDGQIGSEATPAEFVDALIAATREMVRVLKPSGSIFVNLGDKYASTGGHGSQGGSSQRQGRKSAEHWVGRSERNLTGIPTKSLMGIPWRYAIRCIDDLGLILRAEVIWSKCLSGGTHVYARVDGREKVIMVKDLARCAAGTVELWTGAKWSPMLRCDPTPPTEGRAASSAAARQARYRGKPIPPLVADLEIEFRNGERVGCTPNHKWPTHRGIVRADELTVGDVVPTVRLAPGSAQPGGLDDEMTGWLVGLYIAEGSRSEDMVQIASHTRETTRFDRLRDIADAFDGRFALHHTKGNSATATLSGKIIRAILDTYVGGRTAQDKRLAPACWRRSDTFLAAVLDGYLSGDGHYDKKADRWSLGFCANDGLATDLRAMAARLGYSLRLRRTVHKFDGRDFPGWAGTLYTDPTRRKRPDSEIVAIRQSRARQFWNIEIADDPHEFALASGILTENSNGLPESVTDRVRRSHETWFHFTLNPRYYSAVDEVREESQQERPQTKRAEALAARHGLTEAHREALKARGLGDVGRGAATQDGTGKNTAEVLRLAAEADRALGGYAREFLLGGPALGKLPGSVWTIPTEPLRVPDHLGIDHFAAFPTEWPRRIIQGWSPREVCTACGEGRRPVRDGEWHFQSPGNVNAERAVRRAEALGLTAEVIAERYGTKVKRGGNHADGSANVHPRVIELGELLGGRLYAGEILPLVKRRLGGYACACPDTTAPTTPGKVLDPFGGTGTTALVADVLGRDGISVDMSADYCRLAEWRTTDPGQRARAARVEAPPAVIDGQLSLFDELA